MTDKEGTPKTTPGSETPKGAGESKDAKAPSEYEQWLAVWEKHPAKQSTFTYGIMPNYPVKIFQRGQRTYYFAKPQRELEKLTIDDAVKAFASPMDYVGVCAQDIFLMPECYTLIEKGAWKLGPPIKEVLEMGGE